MEDGAGNAIEENTGVLFPNLNTPVIISKGLLVVKLLQQNALVRNWGCWLTEVVLYNGHKMVVVMVVVAVAVAPHHHHNRFTALFPGPPWWAGARRELLDFYGARED